MAVYVVATYDIADPKAYEPYVPQVMPLLAKYGARSWSRTSAPAPSKAPHAR